MVNSTCSQVAVKVYYTGNSSLENFNQPTSISASVLNRHSGRHKDVFYH